MQENIDIKLTEDTLRLHDCDAFVQDASVGGIDIFVGTVRNATKGKEVIRLEFESYVPMALSEMRKICAQAMEKWPIQRISMHHRIGILEIGDVPVIIAVSAAHRKAAFQACRFCIDTLKETVPIWKKEVFADGEVWVAAHP